MSSWSLLAVTATAPSGASLDRVDVGLRCRSPVIRQSCGRVGRRAKRRADRLVLEAGSDFEAAFTISENPTVRWNRVNVILHVTVLLHDTHSTEFTVTKFTEFTCVFPACTIFSEFVEFGGR